MKFIFFSVFLLLIGSGSFAQNQDTAKLNVHRQVNAQSVRYLLPGGKIITSDKLDSVIASWGHKPFSMVHYDKDPGLIGLIPQTDSMKKQYAIDRSKTQAMLNRPAPDFELNDNHGQKIRLSDLKGKVVVLNFWFTSCAPCREEMPKLNKIKNNADPQRVIFLALALDNSERVNRFVKDHAFDYRLLVDSKNVHVAYQVISCPTSMVIDQTGVIRFIQSSGDNIEKTLPDAIKTVL